MTLPGPDSLVTALTLGLLGSGHCLAMCGGIAGALTGGSSFVASALGFRKPPEAIPTPVGRSDSASVSAYATERVSAAFSGDPFGKIAVTDWKSR